MNTAEEIMSPFSLILSFIMSIPLGIAVFHTSKKMGKNPLLWFLLTITPIISALAFPIFCILGLGYLVEKFNLLTMDEKTIF